MDVGRWNKPKTESKPKPKKNPKNKKGHQGDLIIK